MTLSAIHEKLEDIPEQYRDLYTEKNGKYELTGIAGIKTQADVDRVSGALAKERDEHKVAQAQLSVWGDLDPEETMTKLDRLPELEIAAKGKLDDAAIEEIVTKRVEGTIKSQTAPLERQIATLTKERDDALELTNSLQAKERTRTIHDAVREQLVKGKVIGEAHEDALMLADRVFEIREDDGAIVTRDQVGVTPGIGPDIWLQEMQEKRPHWWPPSTGGGARGGSAGTNGFGNNPWSAENWNMTRQGEYVRAHGPEKAQELARAAGTTVGGLRPKSASA